LLLGALWTCRSGAAAGRIRFVGQINHPPPVGLAAALQAALFEAPLYGIGGDTQSPGRFGYAYQSHERSLL
jgi:hypothetical protein